MPVQTQIQVRRSTAATWTSTNPTLAAGELGFETDTGKFKIGTGSSTWTALSYAGGGSQATITTYQYTATAGQTTFSGVDANGNTLAYTAGSVQVYLNGVLLVLTSDYTASNGTSVVLGSGAVVGDNLTVVAVGTFTVSTDIPKSTLTDKGSIVTATAASTPANLSVGTDGQVLTAASGQATGLQWATPVSGSMTSIATGSLSSTSVVISSIPQTYKQLYLVVVNPVANTGSPLAFRFNGVSSASYGVKASEVSSTSFIQESAQTFYEITAGNTNVPTSQLNFTYTLLIENYTLTNYKNITPKEDDRGDQLIDGNNVPNNFANFSNFKNITREKYALQDHENFQTHDFKHEHEHMLSILKNRKSNFKY
jgi:hypothetical protein